MTIQHHPSEALLADYASGALADGPSLTLAAHLESCPACRGAVAAMEQVGGALLDELPDAPLDAQALDLAMARIERPYVAPPRRPSVTSSKLGPLPRALAGRRIGMRRFVTPELWVAHVGSNAADGWRTYLLYAGKGMGLLNHGHKGPELTAVLRGTFRDGGGVYRAGDLAETDVDDTHRPTVEGDDPCLCLISAHGGVEIKGLGRLLRPFLQV